MEGDTQDETVNDFQLIVNSKGGFSVVYKGAKFYKSSTYKENTYFRCANSLKQKTDGNEKKYCPGNLVDLFR